MIETNKRDAPHGVRVKRRRAAPGVPPFASALIALLCLVGSGAVVLRARRRLRELDGGRGRDDASRLRLASLVESADEPIVAGTLDGVIEHWNCGAERVYGYSAAEMKGQSIRRIVPPERFPEVVRILENVRHGVGVYALETERRRKDGTLVPVSITVSPIVDRDGGVLGWSTIAHDMTARKRAEAELRRAHETEHRLRAELEQITRASAAVAEAVAELPQSDVAAVLTMVALQAQSLTHAHYVALGIGDDPAKPFNPWVFLGMSSDVARTIGRFPRPVGTLGRVARDGEVIRAIDLRRHAHFEGLPEGHPEMGSFLGVPIRYRGHPVGNLYLANRRGAAALSEEDERVIRMLAARVAAALETASLYANATLQRAWLQSVIEQMPDGILLYDEAGRLKARNQGAVALSCEETTRQDAYGNPTILDLRAPDGSALAKEQWPITRVLTRGEAFTREEMAAVRRSGDHTPVAVSASPIRTSRGEIAGAMLIVQDISATKELQRLREEWTAVIAHDLRQPVGAIKLGADCLREACRALPEADRHIVERIGAASRRLSRMINDLLDASQIESKRLTVNPQPIELEAFVASVVDDLRPDLAGHEVHVVVEPDLVVSIDPDRMHQVFGNILSNAASYGAPGAEIRVDARPKGEMAEVTITNRGCGIPSDQLPRLFTRFTRLGGARERRAAGLGLGLYITKGLVEAHGGQLWAESTPGDTTSFHFTVLRVSRLPARDDEGLRAHP